MMKMSIAALLSHFAILFSLLLESLSELVVIDLSHAIGSDNANAGADVTLFRALSSSHSALDLVQRLSCEMIAST